MVKHRKRRPERGEEGQATIEFALTLVLLLGVVFFYIQLSLVFAWGNYVHYATFMSARAYMAAGASKEDQTGRAQQVAVSMLKGGAGRSGADRLPAVARGEGGGDVEGLDLSPPAQYSETDDSSSWMEGVRYTFRSRLIMLPMLGTRPNKGANSLTLTSESWLGREPTYSECLKSMDKVGIIDNGC